MGPIPSAGVGFFVRLARARGKYGIEWVFGPWLLVGQLVSVREGFGPPVHRAKSPPSKSAFLS